jgi:hypothetical protein
MRRDHPDFPIYTSLAQATVARSARPKELRLSQAPDGSWEIEASWPISDELRDKIRAALA